MCAAVWQSVIERIQKSNLSQEKKDKYKQMIEKVKVRRQQPAKSTHASEQPVSPLSKSRPAPTRANGQGKQASVYVPIVRRVAGGSEIGESDDGNSHHCDTPSHSIGSR